MRNRPPNADSPPRRQTSLILRIGCCLVLFCLAGYLINLEHQRMLRSTQTERVVAFLDTNLEMERYGFVPGDSTSGFRQGMRPEDMITVGRMLDLATERARLEFSTEPEFQREVFRVLADLYEKIGEDVTARHLRAARPNVESG